MKRGINFEYDDLRKRLYELRVQIKTTPNINLKEANKEVNNILKRMKELEIELIKGGKGKWLILN